MEKIIDTRVFEGLRLKVYKDTVGKNTIGYGHNLDSSQSRRVIAQAGLDQDDLLAGQVITMADAERIYQIDRLTAKLDVIKLVPNLSQMPEIVQDILIDLSFNMGYNVLSTFKNTLSCFNRMDWEGAARGLSNSKWYYQVGNRSRIIVAALRNLKDNG